MTGTVVEASGMGYSPRSKTPHHSTRPLLYEGFLICSAPNFPSPLWEVHPHMGAQKRTLLLKILRRSVRSRLSTDTIDNPRLVTLRESAMSACGMNMMNGRPSPLLPDYRPQLPLTPLDPRDAYGLGYRPGYPTETFPGLNSPVKPTPPKPLPPVGPFNGFKGVTPLWDDHVRFTTL